jgi:hypothetical protein
VRDAVAAARLDVRDVPDGDVELSRLEQFVDVVAGFAVLLGRCRAAATHWRLVLLGMEAIEAVLGEVEPSARRLLALFVAEHNLVKLERVSLGIVLLDEVAGCDSQVEFAPAVVNFGLELLLLMLLLMLLLLLLLLQLRQERLLVVPGGLRVDRVEEVHVHGSTWIEKVTRNNL